MVKEAPDNLQSNGNVARSGLLAFALLQDPELADWIGHEVAFPCSMVDRITPATAPEDIADLRRHFGVEDAWPVACEPFTQWVLEDRFVAGRPPLEQAGVQVTGDVEPYEAMKLRLLNAGHQAIAYSGRLIGHVYAHEAAGEAVFAQFLRDYMNGEAVPRSPRSLASTSTSTSRPLFAGSPTPRCATPWQGFARSAPTGYRSGCFP